MEEIFNHPWMKKMEKHYNISVDQYIYKPSNIKYIEKTEKCEISPPS